MRSLSWLLFLVPFAVACGGGKDTGDTAADADGDGYDASTDCDDLNANIHPGALESCDSIDNDCDGSVDEEGGDVTWYPDADGDGWGAETGAATQCDAPSGFVDNGGDCDDADFAVNPDADEVCDGADNDCNGLTDETGTTWYEDLDGDGYGDDFATEVACDPPDGYVADGGDCDDRNEDTNPGAPEVKDGEDNDCDGSKDEDTGPESGFKDMDGDGYGDDASPVADCATDPECVTTGGDCDDADPDRSPGALEYCDAIDNDCDGTIDGPLSVDAQIWYPDADGDGYGDATQPYEECSAPAGYINEGGDCRDDSATIPSTGGCNKFEVTSYTWIWGWGIKDGEIYEGYTLSDATGTYDVKSQFRVTLANGDYLSTWDEADACTLFFDAKFQAGSLDPAAWQDWKMVSVALVGVTIANSDGSTNLNCMNMGTTWGTDPYEFWATGGIADWEISIEALADENLISSFESGYGSDWPTYEPYFFQGSLWQDGVDAGASIGTDVATLYGQAYAVTSDDELDVETMILASEVADMPDAYYWVPAAYIWSFAK